MQRHSIELFLRHLFAVNPDCGSYTFDYEKTEDGVRIALPNNFLDEGAIEVAQGEGPLVDLLGAEDYAEDAAAVAMLRLRSLWLSVGRFEESPTPSAAIREMANDVGTVIGHLTQVQKELIALSAESSQHDKAVKESRAVSAQAEQAMHRARLDYDVKLKRKNLFDKINQSCLETLAEQVKK